MPNRACLKCCLLTLAALTLAAAALGGTLLAYAGQWLSRADAPVKSNAIVVLGGAFERTLYAADLYAAGFAPRIYLSDPVREAGHRLLDDYGIKIPSESEINRTILKARSVAAADITRFPGSAASTADEGRLLRQLFVGQAQTLLVVTSPFHLRRARLIIGDALAGTPVTAHFLATPYERYAPRWWTDQDSARNTLLELAKVVFYLTGGRFRADEPYTAAMPAPAQ